MDRDGYGEVINGAKTFETIAGILKHKNPVLIGWTDQDMTHFDILFSYWILGSGTHQGGIRRTDLFVSIMRIGSFAFEIEKTDTHPGYYEEKLAGRRTLGSTAEKLAELINGVKKELLKI